MHTPPPTPHRRSRTMAAFQRTVKLRTPMYFYTGDVWTVTMDNDDRISDLLDYEATRQNPKASGMGARDFANMRKLFLLPRWNPERDNIELTNRMLPANASLAAINVRNGDVFDLVANVEVFACLSVIANELAYRADRNDPNLGGGGRNNEVVIQAFAFRKRIGDTKGDTAADDLDQGEHLFRLPGSDLKRESDVDRLWTAAVKFFEDDCLNSNDSFARAMPTVAPTIARLLHKYLLELHELMRDSRSDAMSDALTKFIKNHQPSTSMPYAARLEVTADEGDTQVELPRAKRVRQDKTLAMKLAELKEAKDEGLLSEDVFEARREQVFDAFLRS